MNGLPRTGPDGLHGGLYRPSTTDPCSATDQKVVRGWVRSHSASRDLAGLETPIRPPPLAAVFLGEDIEPAHLRLGSQQQPLTPAPVPRLAPPADVPDACRIVRGATGNTG